jgi:hypothetical protein
MPKAPVGLSDIEPDQDAWQQFERAVDTVVKGGPQHRKRKGASASDLLIRGRAFLKEVREFGAYLESLPSPEPHSKD